MKKSKYQTGLGKAMLLRSRSIFLLLTVLTLLTSGSALYAGFKSGEIQKRIIDPTKQFIAKVVEDYKTEANKPKSSYTNGTTLIYNTSTERTTTTTNGTTVTTPKITTKTQTIIVTPAPNPTYYKTSTKSYEQSVQEMNANAKKAWEEALKKQEQWSAEQKAKNQQWYTENTTKDAAEGKASYDAAVQKMKDDVEAWKKANGF